MLLFISFKAGGMDIMIEIIVRQEVPRDYKETEDVVKKAFEHAEHAGHTEHILVSRLRKGDAFIKELSLVATANGKIIGHILFTRLEIIDGNKVYPSLGLAPLSVLPEYQRTGVGKLLMEEGLKRCTDLGYTSVILLGHPTYYPRFGFKKASEFQIKASFPAPDEAFMAIELVPGSLSKAQGTVKFPEEFEL